MEAKIILDTIVLIDAVRNKDGIFAKIQNLSQQYELCTTDINAFELFYGAYLTHNADKNIAATKGILENLLIFNTDIKSVETSGKLLAELDKKGGKIEVKDVLIAGICLTNNCAIVTSNKKDFERIGVKIIEI